MPVLGFAGAVIGHQQDARRQFGNAGNAGHESLCGIEVVPWLKKFFEYGCGVALVPDRTSAPWWQQFVPAADLVLFVSPKIKFVGADGKPGTSPGPRHLPVSGGAAQRGRVAECRREWAGGIDDASQIEVTGSAAIERGGSGGITVRRLCEVRPLPVCAGWSH